MRMWMLAAGSAALAISAPAMADKNGNGNGGKGGGKDRGAQMKGHQGGGHDQRGGGSAKAESHRSGGHTMVRADHSRGKDRDDSRVKLAGKPDKAFDGERHGRGRSSDDDGARLAGRDFVAGGPFFRNGRQGLDCPPGLEKKDNGCLPPGQAKKLLGAPLAAAFADSRLPYAYRNWYQDDDRFMFRTGDGFIYRVNRSNNLIDGLIPLFGSGYYMVGDAWPSPYNFYNVPAQYQSYWPEQDNMLYRYGDGAIYRLDPTTQAVQSIVALLAGDLGVGSRLPLGYDTYNVPFAYRDRYYDSSDAWYRYNDGYIYRVDPTTRLITAVIDAIV